VTNKLVLRPLITTDKEDIIRLARQIGTAEFAMDMPEYCGVISVKPTVKARLQRVESEEQSFDFSVLEQAIASAECVNIDEMGDLTRAADQIEVFSTPLSGSVIVDIRHPEEQELRPLAELPNKQLIIPFYALHKHLADFDNSTKYLLYCEKGVMSKLHAAHLQEDGFNVAVYRPQ
jgi:thiamine biosynthesis protein ThiI